MSKFFLFYIITLLTRNPLLAILVVLVIYFIVDRQFLGFLPDPFEKLRLISTINRLRKEVEINPHNAKSLHELGKIMVKKGRFGEGVRYLEGSIKRMGDSEETNFYLGLAYLYSGDMEKGKDFIDKAISINPRFGYGEPFLRLGDYYMLKRDWEKAIESLDQFTSIHTSSSEGFYKLGESYLRRDKKDEARRFYRRSIEVFKQSPRYKRKSDRQWAWRAKLRLIFSL